MSKPWDALRKETNPPIGPGTFYLRGINGKVTVARKDYSVSKSAVRVGLGLNEPRLNVGVTHARSLAEFFTELADDLERNHR